MAALDDNAIVIEYANLFVGDDAASAVDVGALRNVRFTSEQIQTIVNSDNRGEILRKSRMPGRIEAELLEPGNAAILESIFKGLITRTTTAGSPVSNATQTIASGDWNFNVFVPLENQNGDGTQPTIDSVTLGTDGAIVLDTDYMVVKDPATGKWGIIIIDSSTVTTESQTVAIQYDYTPAAAQVLTGGTSQTATPRYVKIEAPSEDDSSKKRVIVFESAIANSPMLLAFVEVESAGDVAVMPVTFETRKGTTWVYTDQINPT